MIFQRLPFLSILHFEFVAFITVIVRHCSLLWRVFEHFQMLKHENDITVLYSGRPGPHTELQIRSRNDAGLSQQLLESCRISGLVAAHEDIRDISTDN